MQLTNNFIKKSNGRFNKVSLINLGCVRNLVDSQIVLGRLSKKGYHITDIEGSQVAIVNTCSFVEEARKESIDTILDLIDLKKQGRIRKVIVAGCLTQRYGSKLANELKGVDAFVGTLRLDKENVPTQHALTPKHFAYVKICESCFNQCSFCIIPKIKGKFSSRTIESILNEVRELDQEGVKEINIVGQDITAYGFDIYGGSSLARLLKEIVKLTKNIQRIRLLYFFPTHMDDELIDVIAKEEKICSYIDLPLQHINNTILRSMNRGITKQETIDLLNKIRDKIPTLKIRTTFIVGYPGETDEYFQELLDFVKDFQFERMGTFSYSREERTPAYDFPNQVPERTKRKRLDILMREQREISKNLQSRLIGNKVKVMIDEKQRASDAIYVGRSEYDAPEVDSVVYVRSNRRLDPGDFVDVRITDSYEYDLVGEVI